MFPRVHTWGPPANTTGSSHQKLRWETALPCSRELQMCAFEAEDCDSRSRFFFLFSTISSILPAGPQLETATFQARGRFSESAHFLLFVSVCVWQQLLRWAATRRWDKVENSAAATNEQVNSVARRTKNTSTNSDSAGQYVWERPDKSVACVHNVIEII